MDEGRSSFAACRRIDLTLADEAVQGDRFRVAETAIAGLFRLYKNRN